jgi:hypothetical protein
VHEQEFCASGDALGTWENPETSIVLMRYPRMAKSSRAPWQRSNPRKRAGKATKHLTSAEKSAAKARAKRAGRPYPNLVDNMRAAAKKKTASKKRKTSAAKRPARPAKRTPAKTTSKTTSKKKSAAKKR